jgi:hypothetical protein
MSGDHTGRSEATSESSTLIRSHSVDFGPSRLRPEYPPSASREPGSTDPRTMEEFLKAFDDDLLTAVQSLIDLIVGLTR